jgi:hypothetical protein
MSIASVHTIGARSTQTNGVIDADARLSPSRLKVSIPGPLRTSTRADEHVSPLAAEERFSLFGIR